MKHSAKSWQIGFPFHPILCLIRWPFLNAGKKELIPPANADVADVEATKQKLSTTSCRTKGAAVRCTCSVSGLLCGSCNPAGSPTFQPSDNPTIRQSNNPTIRHWPKRQTSSRGQAGEQSPGLVWELLTNSAWLVAAGGAFPRTDVPVTPSVSPIRVCVRVCCICICICA